jgi:hypothetical protein
VQGDGGCGSAVAGTMGRRYMASSSSSIYISMDGWMDTSPSPSSSKSQSALLSISVPD